MVPANTLLAALCAAAALLPGAALGPAPAGEPPLGIPALDAPSTLYNRSVPGPFAGPGLLGLHARLLARQNCGDGFVGCDGLCIPAGTNCCRGGRYCDAGYQCYTNMCCPDGSAQCNSGCCPDGYRCCADGAQSCLPPGATCCSDGRYCNSGFKCCSVGCAEEGGDCCYDGRSCPSGSFCVVHPDYPTSYCCVGGTDCHYSPSQVLTTTTTMTTSTSVWEARSAPSTSVWDAPITLSTSGYTSPAPLPTPTPTSTADTNNNPPAGMNGQRRRDVDLDGDEIQYSGKWESEVACDGSNKGKRISGEGNMTLELKQDVYGVTVATSTSTDGQLKWETNGVVSEIQVAPAASGSARNGTATGCTYTYMVTWTEGMPSAGIKNTLTMAWEAPLLSGSKRQAPTAWVQVDKLTLFESQADLQAAIQAQSGNVTVSTSPVALSTITPSSARVSGSPTGIARQGMALAAALAAMGSLLDI